MSLKKIARFTLITGAVVVVIGLLLQLFVTLYLNDKIKSILQKRVTEQTQGRYAVSFKNSSVNIFGRTITIEKLALVPVSTKMGHDVNFCLLADKISLSGTDIFSFMNEKRLSANKLSFTNPVIILFQGNTIEEDSPKERVTLYKVISKELKEIIIDKIDIRNARFSIYGNKGKTEILSSTENQIELKTFLVNKRTDSLGMHFLSEQFKIHMKNCVYKTPGGLYTLKGKNVSASYSDSLLTMDSLELVPNFGKKEFGKKAGKQVSRVKLTAESLQFKSMNVQMFIERNWFLAHKLELDQLDIEVHRDKGVELEKTRKPSLQRSIFNIPFKIKLDTIIVKNSDIIYEHLVADKTEPGRISFNRLKGTITGMNNDTSVLEKNGNLQIRATALFMNTGRLNAYYRFPLTTSKEIFFCSGVLSQMPLSAVNPMLERVVYASIRKGTLDSLTFSFTADEKNSKGKMKFLYHDLRIDILDKDDPAKKKKLATFVANTFAKNSNPSKNGELTLADIYYERYPHKYFFYYTWKSLQSGIMQTIGVNSEMLLKRSDER